MREVPSLLGTFPVKDLLKDLADAGLTPDDIERLITGWAEAIWDVGREFGTIAAQKSGLTLEITTYRSEAYDRESRKPEVSYGETLAEDLVRRDFTVNAMAVRLPSLELGCDCLGEITYNHPVLHDTAGEPKVTKNAICLHEEDNAVLWKHVVPNAMLPTVTIVMMNLGFAAYAHRLFREGATGFNKRSQEFFLALFLLLIPGVNLIAFYLGNGYLLGREYFELAAMRHLPAAEARQLRQANRGLVFLCGVIIAGLASVPIVNLLTPLFATAFMVHVYKRITIGQRRITDQR